MRKIRIVYIRTEIILDVLYKIYVDFETLEFIAIAEDRVYKDVQEDKHMSFMNKGTWASFDSFEELKEGITDWAESLSEGEYDPTDSEQKYWDDCATHAERFSHD